MGLLIIVGLFAIPIGFLCYFAFQDEKEEQAKKAEQEETKRIEAERRAAEIKAQLKRDFKVITPSFPYHFD